MGEEACEILAKGLLDLKPVGCRGIAAVAAPGAEDAVALEALMLRYAAADLRRGGFKGI